MPPTKQPSSAFKRFVCGIIAFALWMIGVPLFIEACDMSNHKEPYSWAYFLLSILAFVLAYQVYRPVRITNRTKKETEAAALRDFYYAHPEIAEAHAREQRTKDLARAIAEELKKQ